jgi:hypothetical protein
MFDVPAFYTLPVYFFQIFHYDTITCFHNSKMFPGFSHAFNLFYSPFSLTMYTFLLNYFDLIFLLYHIVSNYLCSLFSSSVI